MKKNMTKLEELYDKAIHRFAHIVKSPGSTGNEIGNSKNCRNCFDVQDCENMKYVNWAGFGYPFKDAYDCTAAAAAELGYEAINVGLGGIRNLFVVVSWYNHHVEYSYNCRNSEYLFGCVGLRNKKYCILNNQYTKEEYNELLPRIKQHMSEMPYTDKKGNVYKYGEFFPVELSPFSYDETIASESFPLNMEEIRGSGYPNFEKPKNEYEVTMKTNQLPDHIKDVSDAILKEVIECGNVPRGKCEGSGVFRLIPRELEFYKKNNLPLPRFCPICRHRARTNKRSPLKLFERQCMCDHKVYKNQGKHKHGDKPCQNTFETTYEPDRPEIVYCKDCYQREVE